ncbi:MAG: tryptophan--tRNA ligase [archaeon]|nr:tryptophan--tRNA ligase [archaeon]
MTAGRMMRRRMEGRHRPCVRMMSSCLSRHHGGKVVFTGCQPSGGGDGLHLGNYLGALLPFVGMQGRAEYERLYFCVVDLHALTTAQRGQSGGGESVGERSERLFATAVAAGVDPERTTVYLQSSVAAHSELLWLLACRTPVHLLNTMTQWKEKRAAGSNAGLYTYPVLMAADILLFGATHVPVGDDQQQHLELARKLADSFNAAAHPRPLFARPLTISCPSFPRVMDLRRPSAKMSKSSPSGSSRLNLCDPADVIASKIRRATTDSLPGLSFDPEARPGLANLLRIHSALSGEDPAAIADSFSAGGFGALKASLVDLLVAKLGPVAARTSRLLEGDRAELRHLIRHGGLRASADAAPRIDLYKSVILGYPSAKTT